MRRRSPMALAALVAAALALAAPAGAAETRHFSFAMDQPRGTGYALAAEIFGDKLMELSHGSLIIDLFPGGQLGQETQILQKLRTGDVDFTVVATANSATVQPEAGVMSIHFIFRSEAHLRKAIADPAVGAAMKELFNSKVEGARVIALATQGFRYLYGRKEIHGVADIKGLKVRVQATRTEDTLFPAYGAQSVHMPFGDLYTSLQTGVVDLGENGMTVYLSNKHYEVAPVMSLSEHEANNMVVWVSQKTLDSLTAEERGWVQSAAEEVERIQPGRALDLERQSRAKLEKIGVRFVEVDKSGFARIAEPIQDQIAAELGPNAVKVLGLIRAAR
jgi:tripartite ATP-independent transporter DctP family solute receptor